MFLLEPCDFNHVRFSANNVLKGIEQGIYFPVREESSKSRFIPELSRTFTGK